MLVPKDIDLINSSGTNIINSDPRIIVSGHTPVAYCLLVVQFHTIEPSAFEVGDITKFLPLTVASMVCYHGSN